MVPVRGLHELVIVDGGSVAESVRVDFVRVEIGSSYEIGYSGGLVGGRVESEEGVWLRHNTNEAVGGSDNSGPVRLWVFDDLFKRDIELDRDDVVFERGFVVDGVVGVWGG